MLPTLRQRSAIDSLREPAISQIDNGDGDVGWNIVGLDLELLPVFDAVMSERNVSRAAHRVGMT
jgi:hypothetical protein